ncbi:transcriptional regulator [Methylobacterium nigriterrae]|uniref:transcriptional regulator n=1 Tax=Methylobacterium nigriterrae TaxID=3127512 RepID=UPI0030132AEF
MLHEELRQAVEAAPRDRLPEVSAAVWKAFSANALTEAQAEELSLAIEARKATGASQKPASGFQRVRATFPARKPQRPPERSVAMERRRRWAAAGRMPPKLACQFTPGEQAALAVVAVEVAKRGTCTLAIGAIAALAGVSETTVRRALRQARALALVSIRERRVSAYRNDTNVVAIISRDWSSWLQLSGQGGCQNRKGTNTNDLDKGRQRPAEPAQRATGGQGRARAAASRDSGTGPSRRVRGMS